MKSPNYFCVIAIVAMSTLFFSCKKDSQALTEDSINLVGKTADYSDPISQQRVDLAKTLVEAFKTNPEMATQTISACNEKFDGDRNVLCSTLFSQTVSTLNDQTSKTNGTKTFGTVLNELATTEGSNKTAENFSENLIESDPLTQLYLFIANTKDSSGFAGIVVVPETYDGKTPTDFLVINKDGSQSLISSEIDPIKNYLVVSHNQRSNYDDSSMATTEPDTSSSYKTQAIRYTKITRASFTSLSAARAVEKWTEGEPDVRMLMIYNVGGVVQTPASFIWPKQWIGGPTIKWNYFLIELPLWDSNTQGITRKIVWVEEDGGKSTTYTTNYSTPIGGATLSTSSSFTIKKDDVIISDNYLDFSNTKVEQNWGAIKFDVN